MASNVRNRSLKTWPQSSRTTGPSIVNATTFSFCACYCNVFTTHELPKPFSCFSAVSCQLRAGSIPTCLFLALSYRNDYRVSTCTILPKPCLSENRVCRALLSENEYTHSLRVQSVRNLWNGNPDVVCSKHISVHSKTWQSIAHLTSPRDLRHLCRKKLIHVLFRKHFGGHGYMERHRANLFNLWESASLGAFMCFTSDCTASLLPGSSCSRDAPSTIGTSSSSRHPAQASSCLRSLSQPLCALLVFSAPETVNSTVQTL